MVLKSLKLSHFFQQDCIPFKQGTCKGSVHTWNHHGIKGEILHVTFPETMCIGLLLEDQVIPYSMRKNMRLW